MHAIQRSVQRQESEEWQGVWEDLGRHLEQGAPPKLWNFIPETVQNPKKLRNA